MTLGSAQVANFVWSKGKLFDVDARASDLVPMLPELTGQFAVHVRASSDTHLLARDPLGVNKLFFALREDGGVDSSNFLIELRKAGHALGDIWSVPSGHYVELSTATQGFVLEKYAKLAFEEAPPEDGAFERCARRVREALDETFRMLAATLRGRRCYVTMSGGLDSTVVAMLAREHLQNVTGVTFCLEDDVDDADRCDDLHFARRAAEALDIPLEVVRVSPDALADRLDLVLTYGQDWRDFNVHCGLVNAAIGEALAAKSSDDAGGEHPVILTGDTMNEIMADYTPVSYRGQDYYQLPRIPTGRLRRFLVNGLDTGDREVGIFRRFGLDTLQPYALCADAYTALPAAYLEDDRAKQRFVDAAVGETVPPFILDRPKVRAQVASSDETKGTLAALVDRGFDQEALLRRFTELFETDRDELNAFIRGGMYRFPTTYPGSPS